LSLSTAEITSIVQDLKPRLEGASLVRLDQPETRRIILHLRRDERRYWLQIVAAPDYSRLHLLTHRPKKSESSEGFCKIAREHIEGASLRELTQVEGDRVVVLEFEARDALLRPTRIRLIAELIGTGSNVILVNESDQILGSLFTEDSRRRRIMPGETFKPLPPPPTEPERAKTNRFAETHEPGDPLALSRAIERLYREQETEGELEERRKALLARTENQRDRLLRRERKLEEELDQARDADVLRREGELLKIALPRIDRGQCKVVVKDLFEPESPEREIELEPELTPEENVQKRFEEYKRRKASLQHVQRRLKRTRNHLAQLRRALEKIRNADDTEAVDHLKQRLEEANLLPAEGRPAGPKEAADSGPRRFTSRDGLEILVARNRQQNHELTFTIARGNDYWVHLLGWPGPHVIIQKSRGQPVPKQTLLDAAHLAIYFSKIRGTDYAEVIYTQRKHVRPIKGAGPGKVRYAHESSLGVRVQKNRLRRLLNRTEGAASD
jgi:predicted ribosome quality control (RQC) complex YloA/Tae2 family protein